MCKSVCKNDVIDIGASTQEEFIIQMVDNAKGVVDYFGGEEKIFYINYAIDITYQCDCGSSDVPFVQDIGILASRDPVAVDRACVDLVHKSPAINNSCLDGLEIPKTDGIHEWFGYIPRYDYDKDEIDLNREGKYMDFYKIQLEAAEKLGLGTQKYNIIEINIFFWFLVTDHWSPITDNRFLLFPRLSRLSTL